MTSLKAFFQQKSLIFSSFSFFCEFFSYLSSTFLFEFFSVCPLLSFLKVFFFDVKRSMQAPSYILGIKGFIRVFLLFFPPFLKRLN